MIHLPPGTAAEYAQRARHAGTHAYHKTRLATRVKDVPVMVNYQPLLRDYAHEEKLAIYRDIQQMLGR